jgi:ankyrin repeat protein
MCNFSQPPENMDVRYDDDEDTYYKKTIEILKDTPEDNWKEYRDTWGQTLLHYAARSGDKDKFAPEYGDVYNSKWEDLLRKFKDHDAIRTRDKKGRSALSWAAETENLVAIRMLLRPPSTTRNIPKARMPKIGRSLDHKGREIYKNDLDNEDQMPLFHLLLRRNRGPQNRLESPRDGHLSIPGRGGSLVPIKDLIWNRDIWRGKSDSPFSTDAPGIHQRSSWQPDYFDKDYLNKKGRDGRSLLSHAVGQGDFDFVRTLLEVEGIDVKLADNDGTTPLMHAIQRRDKKISILLSSYALQDLPHTLIGPNNDSVIESLKWAFQTGLIENRTSGEAVLQHALNLKHLAAAKATLKLGVSPRKAFKYRSDWFELIKDSATQPKYLIVTETLVQGKLMQDKMEYSLDFPDDDRKTNPNRLL